MPYGLISAQNQLHLFFRIADFYSRLYPEIKFSKQEKILKPREIGEVLYTYAGEEVEALAAEKMREIENALPNYGVPAVLLKKGKKFILLDGHRRLRLAWKKKLGWKAFVLVPKKNAKFGVEDAIIGRIRDLY